MTCSAEGTVMTGAGVGEGGNVGVGEMGVWVGRASVTVAGASVAVF